MKESIVVTYLDHSGFAVETAQHLFVFDYYRDPAKRMENKLAVGKPVYIFSSHAHGDHFNPAIAAWQHQVEAYILSSDIKLAGGLSSVPANKLYYMSPYEELHHGSIQVKSFGSTDEGGSFLVEADGWRIFHAGDLNWWHWKGDTVENIAQAKTDFFRELAYLNGQQLDLAFFPVDSRLEEFRDIGVREFVRAASVNHLVAMHACGLPWQPSDFAGPKTVWCPAKPGESRQLSKSS